ncbi:MAG: DUF1348 family protein [Rubrobacter sp.]|nr:DUF1348 family protein [Rubrobacter sp.]
MNSGGPRQAVLYARVSTDEQVKGYSLRQQLDALRHHARSEGYEVFAECEDPGYSGMFLDRPGLDRVRDLVEAGDVSVVLAQDADRIARKAAHRLLLDEEAARSGVLYVALDDWGDESHEGKLLRFMKGWTAEGEALKTAERSRRGSRRKVSEGRLLGASPKPRYGFSYVRDEHGKAVGYEPDPRTMPVVVRVFSMLADGHPIRSVAAALDADGVRTPRGGVAWSRRTIREMALDDVYRPHAFAELRGVGGVPADVTARLDPEAVYGIAWSGRVRVRKVSNARRVREAQDPEEWVGVPVRLDGSGLDPRTVDAARRVLEGNRAPLPVGDRFFELAGGPLRCAHCGCRMIGYARRHKGRPPNPYYRCDSPSRTGSDCPNRRSHPAAALEYEATSLFERTATRSALLDLFDRAVEQQGRRSGLRANTSGTALREALAGTLAELDEERRGYLRQNARGVLSDEELDAMLGEFGERRDAAAAEMRRAEDEAEAAKRIEEARSSLLSEEWYEDPDAVQPDEYLTLGASPEEVRRAYHRLGARFELDEGGGLTLRLELDLGEHPKRRDVASRWDIHGNEHWEFDASGLMRRRDASINDYEIRESERRYRS